MFPAVVILALAISHPLYAQSNNISASDHNYLCNLPTSSANASGIFTFSSDEPRRLGAAPEEGQGILSIPDPSWAITVAAQYDTLQTSIWYDTAGENYSDDLGLTYDVCAYLINGLSPNALELGQSDPGDCSSTLSLPCRKALMDGIAESALMWTMYASPPPYSNLSAGVLPSICNYALNSIASKDSIWPSECSREFTVDENHHAGSSTSALTSYNSSDLYKTNCTMTEGNKTFNELLTYLDPNTEAEYDNKTRNTWVALTVFFPVANWQRTSYGNVANSTLRCLRASNINQGSRTPPALPSGKPWRSGSSLSAGGIAGAVVGSIVGAALIVGGLLWFRRKSQAKKHSDDAAEKSIVPEAGGSAVGELDPDGKKPEMDAGLVAELGNGQGEPGELEGSSLPANGREGA